MPKPLAGVRGPRPEGDALAGETNVGVALVATTQTGQVGESCRDDLHRRGLLDNGNPAKELLGGARPAKPSTWGPMEEGRMSDAICENEGPPAK